MDLELFEKIISQLQGVTKEIAYHIVGDPLVLANLDKYLDITSKYGLKVSLATTGYYLPNFELHSLLHPSIKQINFSLNSYNKNAMHKEWGEYITPLLEFCDYKLIHREDIFINLRIWNLDESLSEEGFNKMVFNTLESHFNISLDYEDIMQNKPKFIRLAPKVRIHFDNYFIWPSLKSTHQSDGFCYGLSSHFGILSDGVVVPCCLDCDGVIELGNLQKESLQDILNSSQAQNIIQGFAQNKATEELCQKCEYKKRFD
jgi:radical SAM protein with 4Fe4S-binding SPASM domain